MGILDHVDSPADLRRLSLSELEALAREIREMIVVVTARNGGHTAPSLGVVELTIALHRAFDTPRDCIVWDVGHQCYAHKIITGRRDRFRSLRQAGGIAGFPKRAESEYDVFDTGHSGDSISVALGLAVGGEHAGVARHCVAVIGDGSIVTGMAFEALNHAGALKRNLTVVLNDNEMSIARSAGAMASYLSRVITGRVYNRFRDDAWTLLGQLPQELGERARRAARKLQEGLKNLLVPSLLFEELGFRYVGPVNGHSLAELISTFRRVRELRGPVLVHVVTRKGEGYGPARREPERFHGTPPFDAETGAAPAGGRSFTAAFGESLVEAAARDKRVVAITAGMCLGTGLLQFRERFPDRFFDVGICEQHAVALGAGLAQAGLRPVVAIYSTFLMRAVDQIATDVCLQKLPVVFAVDRAGFAGEDGPTHHGVFDLAYLGMMPGLVVMVPRSEEQLGPMLQLALDYPAGPVAMRFPRGGSGAVPGAGCASVELGRAEQLRTGTDGCLFCVGSMVSPAVEAATLLAGDGMELAVVDLRFAKPLDTEMLASWAARTGRVFTVEEGTLQGGVGAAVSLALEERGLGGALLGRFGIPDRFVEHGDRPGLLAGVGLSADRLARAVRDLLVRRPEVRQGRHEGG